MSDREHKEWRFITREFLNDPTQDFHSQAYFIGRVEDTSFSKWSTKTIPSLAFTLSDCSEKVTLFFNFQDLPGIQNSRYKLNALRTSVNQFCTALEEELVLREERIAKAKKSKTRTRSILVVKSEDELVA